MWFRSTVEVSIRFLYKINTKIDLRKHQVSINHRVLESLLRSVCRTAEDDSMSAALVCRRADGYSMSAAVEAPDALPALRALVAFLV